jgi:hypothetical protein
MRAPSQKAIAASIQRKLNRKNGATAGGRSNKSHPDSGLISKGISDPGRSTAAPAAVGAPILGRHGVPAGTA